MAQFFEERFDPSRTVVVSNFPADVGKEELTIHFQTKKNIGGGDVDEVVVDENVAFVVFTSSTDATRVLKHPEHVISKTRIKVQSYTQWYTKKKKKYSSPVDYPLNSNMEDTDEVAKTIYVSGIGDSTTESTIVNFFENKKATGGGYLRGGYLSKEGFKRLSPTVVRLTYVSSKDAHGVLKKAEERQLKLDDHFLTVSSVDRSILLVNNLIPRTRKETLKDFVESTKNADVFKVVFGKDGKAIVILKNDIDEDDLDAQSSSEKLEGFVLSLEFAPLTKAIRISNIPQATSSDAIKSTFENRKYGGNNVVNMVFDGDKRVAIIYFEEPSAVSTLVKNEHIVENVSLIVVPYYEEFNFDELHTTDEQTDIVAKITEFQWDYVIDRHVMHYIDQFTDIQTKFGLRMTYDERTSRLHVAKGLDDPHLAAEFENKLEKNLHSFVKDEKIIPKGIFEKVKKTIEDKRDEFNAALVDFSFDGSRVIVVGKKDDVDVKLQLVETMIDDSFTEVGRKQWRELLVDDKNKLKCLNFIDYFVKLLKEFPDVQIHGTDSTSGRLLLLGTSEKTKAAKLKIDQDLANFTQIDVTTSVHQLKFLEYTECRTVNDELKNEDAMLVMMITEGASGAECLQVKIITLKKYDDIKKKLLQEVVYEKTSEKCIKVDDETVTFLLKSEKLQKFKEEQFEKDHVLIDFEIADPQNIWIVCEKSKVNNAEQELTTLINETKITTHEFSTIDQTKLRFLREHCWDKIKEKEKCFAKEEVIVREINDKLFEVKGTKAGRYDMEIFLAILASKIEYETYFLNEPGMRKQMSMDTTDAIISDVEKSHKCVIEKGSSLKETDMNIEETSLVEDERMDLPYRSIDSVNDKEIKLTSGQKITIVVGDLALEKVDVIVNTTNHTVNLNANACGKALLKAAGQDLVKECMNIGLLQEGEIVSTGPAKLSCKRVYHVRSSSWNNGDGALTLRRIVHKCLEQLRKDKLTSIAIPAIGTGNLDFPRSEVSKIFFEEVIRFLTTHPPSIINDVRFVVYDPATADAFLDAVQEIKSLTRRASIPRQQTDAAKGLSRYKSSPNLSSPSKWRNVFRRRQKTTAEEEGISFRIYCNDRKMFEKAWEELERKMKQNIQKRTISDNIIKKIHERDVQELEKLEREYDFEIEIDKGKKEIRFKGHILDIVNVQQKINEILNDIKDNENKEKINEILTDTKSKVPSYWVKTTGTSKFHKFKLSASGKEYNDVEAAFRKTALNQIVSIERIQNKQVYKLFNIKRRAMIKKYRSKFSKMLFHGTSYENLEKINAGGLNRNYAGGHDTTFGRGVYFSRDASYSCRRTYSPPDPQGLRYMYYATVLVGDYTAGERDIIEPPSKSSSDPNDTYDSVVDNVTNPEIYVLFQDYEYYPEYLITFR